MTNSIGKKSRGRRKAYNFLDKKGTTATRQDYIETNYVNGVKDDKGNYVIRPMTAEEKEWLSQFIEETEHGNLNKTSQIKNELKKRKEIKSSWVAAKKSGDVDEMIKLEQAFESKTRKIEELRDNCNNFYTKESDIKEIFDRDNERRRDVYNNAKISDNLVLYDITEYDKFSTESISDIDPENLVLEHLDWVPVRRKK